MNEQYFIESNWGRRALLAGSIAILLLILALLVNKAPEAWNGAGLAIGGITAIAGVFVIEIGKIFFELVLIKQFNKLYHTKYKWGLIVIAIAFLVFLVSSIAGIYGLITDTSIVASFKAVPFAIAFGIELLAFALASVSVATTPAVLMQDKQNQQLLSSRQQITKQALRSHLDEL